MKLSFAKQFKKDFKKFPPSIRTQLSRRLKLLLVEPLHPQLGKHALPGEFRGFLSINITGDIRAFFVKTGNGYLFLRIGTHAQLY